MLRLDNANLRNGVSDLDDTARDVCLRGSISGKSDTIVKNKPGSESVG